MIGRRFGKLVVNAATLAANGRGLNIDATCDCGNRITIRYYRLTSGHQKSCGKARHYPRIPDSVTAEHRVWHGMKRRCYSPTHKNYKEYGERGITVCKRWRESLATLLADMGPRPSPAHTLERQDNDGNYGPSNCRWATRLEQGGNTRRNRILEINGERTHLSEWARRGGITLGALKYRLQSGWDTQAAVFTPLKPSRIGQPWIAAGVSRGAWYRSGRHLDAGNDG